MIVYIITNKINGKQYIGQTVQPIKARWYVHSNKSHPHRSAISCAIQKYGKENFEMKALTQAQSLDELNQLEKYYIKEFNTLAPNGYNLIEGGKSFIPSAETRLKMSLAHKGKKHTEEQKQKLAEASRNRVWKIESKEKLARLKAKQVQMIKYLLNEGVLSTTIADLYNVKLHVITDIKRGKTWRDLKALKNESNGVQ